MHFVASCYVRLTGLVQYWAQQIIMLVHHTTTNFTSDYFSKHLMPKCFFCLIKRHYLKFCLHNDTRRKIFVVIQNDAIIGWIDIHYACTKVRKTKENKKNISNWILTNSSITTHFIQSFERKTIDLFNTSKCGISQNKVEKWKRVSQICF